MPLLALQILFVFLVLTTYGLGVYAVELLGLKPYVSVPGIAAVAGFLWWLFNGKKSEEAKEAAQQKVRANLLTEPDRLKWACGIMALALVAVVALVYFSETVVFYTDQEGKITVNQVANGNKTHQGYIEKGTPFKKRYFSGNHTFTFESDGFEPDQRPVLIGQGPFIGDEKHHLVALRAIPTFAAQHVSIGSGEDDTPDTNQYPAHLTDQPSHILRFNLASTSPTPFEITALEIDVKRVDPIKGWTFPYYGEAPQIGAVPVRGYAVLGTKPGRVPVTAAETAKVGAKLDTAQYIIRLFSEPGHKYEIDLLVHWTDLNHQDRRKSTPVSIKQTFENRPDWRKLVTDSPKVRIVYNCRIDKLLPTLDRLKPKPAYSLLVSDPNAEGFFNNRGIKLPAGAAILSPKMQQGLAKLVPTTNPDAPRLCSFIIVDETRMLMQDVQDNAKGELVTDRDRIQAISREFEAARKSLGK